MLVDIPLYFKFNTNKMSKEKEGKEKSGKKEATLNLKEKRAAKVAKRIEKNRVSERVL